MNGRHPGKLLAGEFRDPDDGQPLVAPIRHAW